MMLHELPQYICAACSKPGDVRIYRGTNVLITLCDDCALLGVFDGNNRELRVRATTTNPHRPVAE